MRVIFKWCFYKLDVFEQIAIKRSLRTFIDRPINQSEEGQELLQKYAKELLSLLNKGQFVKF